MRSSILQSGPPSPNGWLDGLPQLSYLVGLLCRSSLQGGEWRSNIQAPFPKWHTLPSQCSNLSTIGNVNPDATQPGVKIDTTLENVDEDVTQSLVKIDTIVEDIDDDANISGVKQESITALFEDVPRKVFSNIGEKEGNVALYIRSLSQSAFFNRICSLFFPLFVWKNLQPSMRLKS